MKRSQVIRNIDDLARVVIPKDIRKQLDIVPRDALLFEVDGSKIIVQKAQNSCVFCGSKSSLTQFGNRFVCASCKKELLASIEEQ